MGFISSADIHSCAERKSDQPDQVSERSAEGRTRRLNRRVRSSVCPPGTLPHDTTFPVQSRQTWHAREKPVDGQYAALLLEWPGKPADIFTR